MVETCCTAPLPNIESCSDSVLEDDSINSQRYWHLPRLRPVTFNRVSERGQLHNVCQYRLPVAGCQSSTKWPTSRRLIHRAAVRLSGPRICAAQSDLAIENWHQPILHRESFRFFQRLVLLRCTLRGAVRASAHERSRNDFGIASRTTPLREKNWGGATWAATLVFLLCRAAQR